MGAHQFFEFVLADQDKVLARRGTYLLFALARFKLNDFTDRTLFHALEEGAYDPDFDVCF